MNDLPMKRDVNLFDKIKNFFKKFFNSKTELKNYNKRDCIKTTIEKKNFENAIKIEERTNEALIRIERQEKRNKMLERIAENPELLNNLSMDELTEIENIYDEEIKKLKKNT